MGKSVCIANGSFKDIDGSITFSYTMATALADMVFSVYYYSPDMDGRGNVEKEFFNAGIQPYNGQSLDLCLASQDKGLRFVGKCPVIQTCHSIMEQPVSGMSSYVAITEEVCEYLVHRGLQTTLVRSGIDLKRFCPRKKLNDIPKVLSVCQGDDSLLREACIRIGWRFQSVPKDHKYRVWHIEDLMNNADLVVGSGRVLYEAMACGRACLSWDNCKLAPTQGCGYVDESNWYECANTNFTGRGFLTIEDVDVMMSELQKYDSRDGDIMRGFAERELDARKNAVKYLSLAGIPCSLPFELFTR